ncbi:hypothetical protein [Nocardioides sp. SR21]|uniref:hypothetical protein n=1 Tax=Nocardioides sp. SR21 TaxID=2919501 RepID=UPI001FAAEE1C|nr:hypothetical protein [Nocardioides sp. SR21]
MSKIYASAVPLTMVRTVEGSYSNVLQDEQIPAEIVHPDDLKRLVRKGFLVEVEAQEADEPSGPPSKSASKADWEAYARSQGATDEDLEGVTKDDLVATYGE